MEVNNKSKLYNLALHFYLSYSLEALKVRVKHLAGFQSSGLLVVKAAFLALTWKESMMLNEMH